MSLHLVAEHEPEARLISALTQDAIIASSDVAFDTNGRTAALLLSRYRWEDGAGSPSRVRSLLVVRNVASAQRARWPSGRTPLALLSMRVSDRTLRFDFADAVGLKLTIENLRVALEDLGDPWRVRHAPRHEAERSA